MLGCLLARLELVIKHLMVSWWLLIREDEESNECMEFGLLLHNLRSQPVMLYPGTRNNSLLMLQLVPHRLGKQDGRSTHTI